jgi:hypothetical protein
MSESWIGSWWRPGHDEEVGGELTVDDGGCALVLFGTFAELDLTPGKLYTFPLSAPLTEPMIHGFASGKRLTLLNAECAWPRGPMFGTERWTVEAAVEEQLAVSGDDESQTFRGLRVELQHLSMWARARGVDQRFLTQDNRVEIGAQPHDLGSASYPTGRRSASSKVSVPNTMKSATR